MLYIVSLCLFRWVTWKLIPNVCKLFNTEGRQQYVGASIHVIVGFFLNFTNNTVGEIINYQYQGY